MQHIIENCGNKLGQYQHDSHVSSIRACTHTWVEQYKCICIVSFNQKYTTLLTRDAYYFDTINNVAITADRVDSIQCLPQIIETRMAQLSNNRCPEAPRMSVHTNIKFNRQIFLAFIFHLEQFFVFRIVAMLPSLVCIPHIRPFNEL